MPVVGRLPRPRAIVAAASRVNFDDPIPFRPEPDSDRLWGYYHALGEVRYVVNFKAQAANRLTYFPARRVDPDQDPEPVEDGPALEAFERVQGPLGEFGEFVAELCPHLDIVGEGYFVADADDEFDVWSSDEMRRATQDSPRQHQDAVDGKPSIAIRIWRSDPQWRHKPDSPLRSVATEADTLILLRDMTQALAMSRLPGKILAVPDEMSLPPTEENADDEFFEALTKAVSQPVTNSKSAMRVAPIVIQGPGDRIGQIKDFDLTRDMPEWVDQLVEQTLRRLAAGLDFPADMLLGLADVNHWSAWVIEESTYKQHVDPLVQLILDSLTRGYLWPYLREVGKMSEEQVREHSFWRDYSDLTARTASVETSIEAQGRGIISDEAARKYMGFNEADAPEVDEGEVSVDTDDLQKRAEVVGIFIRSGFTPEGALKVVGLPEIPHTGLLPVTVKDKAQLPTEGGSAEPADITPGSSDTPADLPAGPGNTEPTTPLVAAATPAEELVDIDAHLFTQLSEAAQAAVDRALERAGNRIRSSVNGGSQGRNRRSTHSALAAKIEGVEAAGVGLALGRATVAETLQLTDDELVPEGTFDGLARRARSLLENAQDRTFQAARSLMGDVTRDEAAERTWRDRAVELLVATVSAITLGKLFTPDARPDPAATGEVGDGHVPAAEVFAVMTVASGGAPSTEPGAPRGLAQGQQTHEWVIETNHRITEREWRVGHPSQPFEPHQRLSGTRFDSWTDPRLESPLAASWVGPFLYPGDHRGCQCFDVLVIEPPEPEA